jgi:hypothetical protein
MSVVIGPGFFKSLAQDIRLERESRFKQLVEAENELVALEQRLSRLRMWQSLECINGCIRLQKSKSF